MEVTPCESRLPIRSPATTCTIRSSIRSSPFVIEDAGAYALKIYFESEKTKQIFYDQSR